MTFVVDASVAVKWFVEEAESAKARDLLASPHVLLAPDSVVAEVCNAAWKLHRGKRIGRGQMDLIAERIGDAFQSLKPVAPLAPRASSLARLIDLPVYDCFYVALAEVEAAPLVTDDAKLMERLRRHRLASRAIVLTHLTLRA